MLEPTIVYSRYIGYKPALPTYNCFLFQETLLTIDISLKYPVITFKIYHNIPINGLNGTPYHGFYRYGGVQSMRVWINTY